MTTVVNNPAGGGEGTGMGMMVGAVILVVVILLLIFFGLPYLRGGNGLTQQNVNAPATQPGIQINVPDKVDVNVNPGQ